MEAVSQTDLNGVLVDVLKARHVLEDGCSSRVRRSWLLDGFQWRRRDFKVARAESEHTDRLRESVHRERRRMVPAGGRVRVRRKLEAPGPLSARRGRERERHAQRAARHARARVTVASGQLQTAAAILLRHRREVRLEILFPV